MKSPDANDALRRGTLAFDPVSEAEPYAASRNGAATLPDGALGWRALEELLREADAGIEYLWPGLIAKGALTLLAAPPKVGKTWLVVAWLAALLRHDSWLTHPPLARDLACLIVTEEPAFVVKAQARRFGLAGRVDVLTVDRIPPGTTWEELISAVCEDAKRTGAEILIVDTVSTLAGMEDENNAADVNAALRPLRVAAQTYQLAVLAIHHAGANGQIRGSTVFQAVPDVLVEARRDGPEGSPRRSLHVRSRIEGSPERPIVVEYEKGGNGPATFRLVPAASDSRGDAQLRRDERADEAIRTLLEDVRDDGDRAWLRVQRMVERLGGAERGHPLRLVQGRLPVLVGLGSVQRDLEPGRGGAHVYAAPGVAKRADGARLCHVPRDHSARPDSTLRDATSESAAETATNVNHSPQGDKPAKTEEPRDPRRRCATLPDAPLGPNPDAPRPSPAPHEVGAEGSVAQGIDSPPAKKGPDGNGLGAGGAPRELR